MQELKKVAILGRPNVGKSSLFNRLARQRDAITADVSGTTRDIKKRIVTISGNHDFEVIDTGGIDYSSELFPTFGRPNMATFLSSCINIIFLNNC